MPVIKVVPVEEFDFVNISQAKSQTVTVASQIDISAYREVDLVARLHTVTWPTSGDLAYLEVRVVQDAHTDNDPATELFGETLCVATFQQSNHDDGSAIVKRLRGALGNMVAVQLKAHQSDDASPGVFDVALSVDLVGRS